MSAGLTPSLRTWPQGGLAHPLFDAPGPKDHVLAIFTFGGAPSEPALDGVEDALEAWSRAAGRLDPHVAVHAEEPFLSRTALRIRAHNLQHPREAMGRLLLRLQGAVPVTELFVARLEPIGGELFAPARDPAMPRERAHFHDAEEFLACLFDSAGDPPASEYASQLAGGFKLPRGEVVVEERGMPLHFPRLRLGYGSASGGFAPADAPSAKLAEALQPSLESAFSGVAGSIPAFFDHTGQLGAVDRLRVAGRTGYGLGMASASLVYRYAQGVYRYREPEVFEAVAEVVKRLGLSPAVCWQRFGEPLTGELRSVRTHVIQLWDP